MPDMVQIWINELENAVQKPEEIFLDELSTAHNQLEEQDFLDIIQRI